MFPIDQSKHKNNVEDIGKGDRTVQLPESIYLEVNPAFNAPIMRKIMQQEMIGQPPWLPPAPELLPRELPFGGAGPFMPGNPAMGGEIPGGGGQRLWPCFVAWRGPHGEINVRRWLQEDDGSGRPPGSVTFAGNRPYSQLAQSLIRHGQFNHGTVANWEHTPLTKDAQGNPLFLPGI